MDSQVASSIVAAAGSIIGGGITAVTAVLVGKRLLSRDKLKKELDRAVQDIWFLLKVEERHCELHRENNDGASNRLRVRNYVFSNGLTWSGSFTPGRIRNKVVAAPHSLGNTRFDSKWFI